MPSVDVTQEASAGAIDASSTFKTLVILTKNDSKTSAKDDLKASPEDDSKASAKDDSKASTQDGSKESTSNRAAKLAAGEKLKQADLPVFPTERQPYWQDPSVDVVTETYAVVNKHGGWTVKKKKYLEYPDGRKEGL